MTDTTTTPPGGGDTTFWYTGHPNVDESMVTALAAKGWDKMEPKDAAVNAVKSYLNAEKLLGGPADQLIRLPKEENAPEWQSVYTRLGKPADKTGYDFKDVKRENGTDLDPSFVAQAQDLAFDLNLSPAAAKKLAATMSKMGEASVTAGAAEQEAKVAAERTALEANWGVNFASNKIAAQQAATALGVKAEEISALEKVVGYSKVMEMFRNIAVKIGEHPLVTPEQGGGGGSLIASKDAAVSRKSELMKDSAWRGRYLAGGSAEIREMTNLNKIITGSEQ